MFGRGMRLHIDSVTPELDASDFLQHCSLHNLVADRKEAWRKYTRGRNSLFKRHERRPHQRSRGNADIQRASAEAHVKKGDLVVDPMARGRTP